MEYQRIIRVGAVTLAILLIPLFGNIFIDGWNWSFFDFIVMGGLIFVTGLIFDFVVTKAKSPFNKFVAGGTVILIFLLLWVELAVDAVSRTLEAVF